MTLSFRKPNTKCFICSKSIYKRPVHIKRQKYVFCSRICYGVNNKRLKNRVCDFCKIEFTPTKHQQKFCSHSCAASKLRGTYKKNFHGARLQNNTERKLFVLRDRFHFTHCMIQGCAYDKTYDIHRLIPGKQGGKYEIGNIFAICPNHHAETHRKLIVLQKVNNYTLKIVNPPQSP